MDKDNLKEALKELFENEEVKIELYERQQRVELMIFIDEEVVYNSRTSKW